MNDRANAATGHDLDVVVVGAGFAGLYMLQRLRERGLAVQVLEAGEGVGGTWYWNRYPGARCDIQSFDYSYSFSEELQQEWRWRERYPAQPEILAYLDHVADRFDLRRDIRFATRVDAAVFDEHADRWTVTADDGGTWTARFVVMATGCLSVPKRPDLPGVDTFAGESYLTAEWPAEGVDLAGRRVGVIGTGSTGIQFTTVAAREAGELFVFQRSPNYSLPAVNHPLDDAFDAGIKAGYAERRQRSRESRRGYLVPDHLLGDRPALEVPDDERRAVFQRLWDHGGPAMIGSFPDVMTDEDANRTAADFVREKIHEVVHDPVTADVLSPIDHPVGTRRPCIDTGYYETFNRENVHLVDVGAQPIEAVTAQGVRTADAEYELDVLVYALGFDAMTGALLAVDVRGPGGSLRDAWAAGPTTYLGLAVAGFPNLFTVTGPGSPSVLSNMITSIEQHVEWIDALIGHVTAEGITRVEARADAEADWTRHVAEVADATLYPRAAKSWYLGANVDGKPRGFMPYVGGVGAYRAICDDVAARGYVGFELAAT